MVARAEAATEAGMAEGTAVAEAGGLVAGATEAEGLVAARRLRVAGCRGAPGVEADLAPRGMERLAEFGELVVKPASATEAT